jgi:DNA-binding transcriptional regulator YdaS (Cro superfamily)
MSKLTVLKTVKEVVEILGGTVECAERFNVSPSAVSHWLAEGSLPSARFIAISEALEVHDCLPAPTLFKYMQAAS